MKIQEEHLQRFADYRRFWRRVLVDILEWPEKDFSRFVSVRRAWLREEDPVMFFHDPPYKYVCRELLSDFLKKQLVGLDVIVAGYRLMETLAEGPYECICEEDFDVDQSRLRYRRLPGRIERIVRKRGTLDGLEDSPSLRSNWYKLRCGKTRKKPLRL